VILRGCFSSHLFIEECASISAFSRGPVMTFPGISTPLGYMATDHCSRSIRTRTVYRMPRYSTGPVWTEIRSGAMSMVAIGGKADIASGCSNRPHWHLADILVALNNVRFWGQRGHQRPAIRCPLLTQSGHSRNSSLTTSSLLVLPRTQVATSRRINLHLIDAPKRRLGLSWRRRPITRVL
jgi:hypothetical protein